MEYAGFLSRLSRRGVFLRRTCLLALPALVLLAPAPSMAAQGTVSLTVRSTGRAQTEAPVFTGIPFPLGALRDAAQVDLVYNGRSLPRQVKVLSEYPDGSIRVVLVGFRVSLSAGQTLSAGVRYGGAPGASLTPAMPWSRNLEVLALCPPRWYGESGVFNLRFLPAADNTLYPAFESQMRANYREECDPPSNLSPDYRNYYDHVHSSYMTLLRDGGPTAAPRRIWDELQQYREREVVHSGPYRGQYHAGQHTTNTYPMWPQQVRRLYVQGLLEDYYLTGDERSFEVAREMGEAYLQDAYLSVDRFRLSERLPGFAIQGCCALFEATLDARYLAAARHMAKVCMDHQDAMAAKYPNQGGKRGQTGAFVHDKNGRWDDPSESTASGCGSPWMTGVLAEGLVRLYWLTGDARVRASVVRAADWVANTAFIPAGDGQNTSGDNALWYICRASDNREIYPALSPMTYLMLGFAHQVSADPKYLQLARKLLEANNWGNSIKEYNQAMRSSAQGLYLLQAAPGTRPLTLAESGSGTGDARPDAPRGLRAYPALPLVHLRWTAATNGSVAGYHVYRAATENGAYVRRTAAAVKTGGLTDSGIAAGSTHWYRVTAISAAGLESLPSSAVSTAQTPAHCKISGRVAHAGSGLVGVTVSSGGRSALTSADGTFVLDGLVTGTYSLTASREGYRITPAPLVIVVTADVSGVLFTAAPTESGALDIYEDAPLAGWAIRSFRSIVDAGNASPVRGGRRSMALTVRGRDGYALLSGQGIALSGRSRLRFFVHGGTSGRQLLRVRAVVNGAARGSLNLHLYAVPRAGEWIEYSIPLSDFGATQGSLTGVKFFAGSRQKIAFIDSVRLE